MRLRGPSSAVWVLVAAVCAGCAGNPGGSAIALEVDSLAGDVEITGVARDVEARLVNHVIFWVPTRTSGPTLAEAIEEALKRGNGDLLTNAHVERVSWYVPLVYGEFGWVVRGDVVQVRKRRAPVAVPETR